MKPVSSLTNSDFDACPVWRHKMRNEQDWAEPQLQQTVVTDHPRIGYIVRSRFTLRDGTVLFGFCSPQDLSGIDYVQPVICGSDQQIEFWDESAIQMSMPDGICRVLDRSANDVFPVQYESLVECDGTIHRGEITLDDLGRPTWHVRRGPSGTPSP